MLFPTMQFISLFNFPKYVLNCYIMLKIFLKHVFFLKKKTMVRGRSDGVLIVLKILNIRQGANDLEVSN